MSADSGSTLILGIGNILLSDDGVGVHVIHALEVLQTEGDVPHKVELRDGGTVGLSLLTDIQETAGLIAVDAMEFGAPLGTVRVFENSDMDRQLTGKKRTAHEVGLADLMSAARLIGSEPRRRALVAIQPASTEWGLEPTPAVAAAVPRACAAVISLLEAWRDGH